MNLSAPASPAITAALARIDASRQRLRGALIPREADPGTTPPAARGRTLRRLRAALRRGLAQPPLRPLRPLLDPAWAAMQGWWQHHPWRGTGEALGHALAQALGPVVRRHPVLTVSVAAAAGAGLVAARPWRWQPLATHAQRARREALHASLGWSWRQLSQPSVQMALAAALAAWAGQEAAAAAPAPSGSAQEPQISSSTVSTR
jgi:hypothetical protein